MNNIDFTNFLNSMLTSITTQQVLSILTTIIGVGMAFFLMWLGVRLITNRFTKAVEGGNITGTFSHEELKEALKTNSAFSEATMTKTIGEREIAPRPIEPVEPTGIPMTREERKKQEDWENTHYSNGKEIGYDIREMKNYYKKNYKKYNNYNKKYNNYKKKYYYDSYGNKYYK